MKKHWKVRAGAVKSISRLAAPGATFGSELDPRHDQENASYQPPLASTVSRP